MKVAITIFVLLLTLAGAVTGQYSDNDSYCHPPDRVMSQVVDRIVRSYFKPRRKTRTVYFSDQSIRGTWLPKVHNTKFIVIPEAHLENRFGRNVFIFDHGPKERERCVIYFGIFDPGSGGEGDIWHFRFARNRLSVWRSGDHWGSGGIDKGPSKN